MSRIANALFYLWAAVCYGWAAFCVYLMVYTILFNHLPI